MAYTKLVFGFPVRSQHAFTSVKEDGAFCQDGTIENWLEVFARAQGIDLLPPFVDDELHEHTDEELQAREELERQWHDRVGGVLNEQFGGVSLLDEGDSEMLPTFVVAGIVPKLEHEKDVYCLQAVPDLTVPPVLVESMKRFCEVMGIAWEEPRWFLSQTWGFE